LNVRHEKNVNGRLVAFYSLTEEYNRLFSEEPAKPDLTPLYALFFTYLGFIIASYIFGEALITLLKPLGIRTAGQLTAIGIVGLFTTLIPLVYYTIKFISVESVKKVVRSLKNLKEVIR